MGLAASCSHLSAQNLIDLTYGAGAGSFELVNYVNNYDPQVSNRGLAMRLPTGSTAITGWTAGTNGVDIFSPSQNWLASSGAYSVDLIGSGNPGGITTRIPTLVGSVYTVSFQTAEFISFSSYSTTASVAGIGDIGTHNIVGEAANLTFVPSGFYTFTAISPFSDVSFRSNRNSFSFGMIIDDVVITGAAIPEPTSALLLSLGATFGLLRRRVSRA